MDDDVSRNNFTVTSFPTISEAEDTTLIGGTRRSRSKSIHSTALLGLKKVFQGGKVIIYHLHVILSSVLLLTLYSAEQSSEPYPQH